MKKCILQKIITNIHFRKTSVSFYWPRVNLNARIPQLKLKIDELKRRKQFIDNAKNY